MSREKRIDRSPSGSSPLAFLFANAQTVCLQPEASAHPLLASCVSWRTFDKRLDDFLRFIETDGMATSIPEDIWLTSFAQHLRHSSNQTLFLLALEAHLSSSKDDHSEKLEELAKKTPGREFHNILSHIAAAKQITSAERAIYCAQERPSPRFRGLSVTRPFFTQAIRKTFNEQPTKHLQREQA